MANASDIPTAVVDYQLRVPTVQWRHQRQELVLAIPLALR